MKKEFFTKIANGLKSIANELNDEAKARLEEIAAAVVSLSENADDEGKEEIKGRIDQLRADLDKLSSETSTAIAERIQKLRDELSAKQTKSVKDMFTPQVRREIMNAILDPSHIGLNATLVALDEVCRKNGITIKRTKNDVSGLSYTEIVDYALQLKQEDNDEIFDALYKTNRSKFFYGELDPTNAKHIAKQWTKGSSDQKAEQELALNGKTIATAYIYKLQSLAHEDLDDAREAGQESALLNDIRRELMKAVKGLAVRAIMVGDAYNPSGAQVSVFETIGTKSATDLFTTVVNPAVANTVSLVDIRKTAAAVKTERKWLVISSALKLALATRVYAQGGTEFFFTDDELAKQFGVDRVIEKDFVDDVQGLHAIVFDPSEYWVKIKNTIDTPFPEYRDNRQGYIYEQNMGGAIHGLKSTAILAEA